MKKVSKKEIKSILRKGDLTQIYRIAKLSGVDVNNRNLVYDFVRDNAPNKKVYYKAYKIAYLAKKEPVLNMNDSLFISNVSKAINHAKKEKKEGKSSYSKVLIKGNQNIYWASAIYQHDDYNKSIAFENNERNMNAALIINNFLNS